MKSIVAIVLASLIFGNSLLPNFGFDQSAKVAELVGHFQEHRRADPSLNFLDFLAMHYGAGSEHRKHPSHNHQHLPSMGHHATPGFISGMETVMPTPPFQATSLARSISSRYSNFYQYTALSSLLNPPRRAV